MKRFKCKITKDKELLVERIPGRSYYYKFTFKYPEEITINHKRLIIIGGRLYVSYTYGHYEEQFGDLNYRISRRMLYKLIRDAES